MNALSTPLGAGVSVAELIDVGADGASVTIPDAHFLFHADFKRTGSDLTLTGDDGHRLVAAVAFARYGTGASSQAAHVESAPAGAPQPEWPTLLPPPPPASRVLLPGGAVLSTLPGEGDLLALTLDDGVDTNVVHAYAQLAHDTGIRLTMFVTGVFASWTDNRDLLLPLVESGQIQLGNHTWLHHDLTKMTGREIAAELRHTDQFIKDTFGADATPYYCLPYGAYNDLVGPSPDHLGTPQRPCGTATSATTPTEPA